ncbi:hypothetical protein TNCV_3105581 [Trichonephila clavipes]|nr:hypothetical protein TNCV_3105581 [Trichonephila clavipes]
MCERVSVEIGVHPVFIWRPLHFRILERILYLVRLISFDWSRVGVWLPHTVNDILSAGNSNDTPRYPDILWVQCPSRRGNVSPFARVRPQRWGKKDAFHRIPFFVNRANVKTAIITLGTGNLPSI